MKVDSNIIAELHNCASTVETTIKSSTRSWAVSVDLFDEDVQIQRRIYGNDKSRNRADEGGADS